MLEPKEAQRARSTQQKEQSPAEQSSLEANTLQLVSSSPSRGTRDASVSA